MRPDASLRSYERVDCMGRIALRVFPIPQKVPYDSDATDAFRALHDIGETAIEGERVGGTARRNLKEILPSV